MRAVSTSEAEWDEKQQAWVLAHLLDKATRCPVCGGDPAECQDPAGDPDVRENARVWRTPDNPSRCYRATVMARQADKYTDNKHPQALIYRPRREVR